jgi:hypothetical protein
MCRAKSNFNLLLQLAGWGQLILLAALFWLSIDRHAHEQIHVDHQGDDSQCAVTWLAQGKVSFVAAAVPIAFFATEEFFLLWRAGACFVPRAPHSFPFACGPPQV